jgi:spore coat protein JB
MAQRSSLLREIQELEFTLIELNLFLDTHPQDRAALRDFGAVRNKLLQAIKQYEELYGPLTAASTNTDICPWQWIEEPWPWEIEYV